MGAVTALLHADRDHSIAGMARDLVSQKLRRQARGQLTMHHEAGIFLDEIAHPEDIRGIIRSSKLHSVH